MKEFFCVPGTRKIMNSLRTWHSKKSHSHKEAAEDAISAAL
jgi:hypothetical protein